MLLKGHASSRGELMGWSAMLLAVFPVKAHLSEFLEAHLRFLSSHLCLSS